MVGPGVVGMRAGAVRAVVTRDARGGRGKSGRRARARSAAERGPARGAEAGVGAG